MTRLTVNISDHVALTLRYLAMEHGNTVTEEVRRAIAVLDYLEAAQASGQRIRTIGPDGAVTWVTLT